MMNNNLILLLNLLVSIRSTFLTVSNVITNFSTLVILVQLIHINSSCHHVTLDITTDFEIPLHNIVNRLILIPAVTYWYSSCSQ